MKSDPLSTWHTATARAVLDERRRRRSHATGVVIVWTLLLAGSLAVWALALVGLWAVIGWLR